jgi:hypothetical protein
MPAPVPLPPLPSTFSGATNFSSVKLSAELVHQAKQAAGPLRRSTAGQIEYWATLGRVVEHSGLTAQEARTAIEGYEAAARRTFLANAAKLAAPSVSSTNTETLSDLKQRILTASTNGSLQSHIRQIVEANRQQAPNKAAA